MASAKAIKVAVVQYPELSSIPHGEYRGTWHGYGVEVSIHRILYELSLDQGIRGWSDCLVKVTPAGVFVESIDAETTEQPNQ